MNQLLELQYIENRFNVLVVWKTKVVESCSCKCKQATNLYLTRHFRSRRRCCC